jgi:hypothetical protein
MIYQKSLKELNRGFPKLNLSPPSRVVPVGSIVTQVECQYLSNSEWALIRNPETA